MCVISAYTYTSLMLNMLYCLAFVGFLLLLINFWEDGKNHRIGSLTGYFFANFSVSRTVKLPPAVYRRFHFLRIWPSFLSRLSVIFNKNATKFREKFLHGCVLIHFLYYFFQ